MAALPPTLLWSIGTLQRCQPRKLWRMRFWGIDNNVRCGTCPTMGLSVTRYAAAMSGILVACASSASSPTGGSTPAEDIPGFTKSAPLTLEQYCEARVALHSPWLSYYGKCCTEKEELLYSSALINDANYASKEACVTFLTGLQTNLGVAYVGAYASAYLEEVGSLIPAAPETCSGTHFGEQLTAALGEQGKRRDGIRAMLQGTIAEGGTCTASLGCKFGLICEGSTGSYKCRRRSTGSCTFSDSCSEGMDCVSGLCQSPTRAGSQCSTRGDCPFGLVCTAGTCSSGGGAGASCTSGEACKPGLGCAVASSSCVTLKVTGEACTTDGECAGRCSKGRCIGRCGGAGSF
jgi:hypothetical protein